MMKMREHQNVQYALSLKNSIHFSDRLFPLSQWTYKLFRVTRIILSALLCCSVSSSCEGWNTSAEWYSYARWIKIYVFEWHISWNIFEIYCSFSFRLSHFSFFFISASNRIFHVFRCFLNHLKFLVGNGIFVMGLRWESLKLRELVSYYCEVKRYRRAYRVSDCLNWRRAKLSVQLEDSRDFFCLRFKENKKWDDCWQLEIEIL